MPLPYLQSSCSHLLQPSDAHQSFKNLHRSPPLPKTLFPCFELYRAEPLNRNLCLKKKKKKLYSSATDRLNASSFRASVLETPVLWVGRLCVFYALLKAGLAGSHANPLFPDYGADDLGFSKRLQGLQRNSDSGTGGDDLGFSKWLQLLQRNPDKEAADRRKLVSKWHPTTKGTLRRNYRVPSKSEGRRVLKAIAALLSDDDHFTDATSHKGCQIRRESAHGESVCCNNVRALFDELPTPHVVVEIMAFPSGPLTEKDYGKAEKLEKVLRSAPSV